MCNDRPNTNLFCRVVEKLDRRLDRRLDRLATYISLGFAIWSFFILLGVREVKMLERQILYGTVASVAEDLNRIRASAEDENAEKTVAKVNCTVQKVSELVMRIKTEKDH